MRVNIQGWHQKQLIKLAEEAGLTPTSYINKLITQAHDDAKENKNEEDQSR
ncbi:hypothetical protein ACAS46_002746 [Vibrio vulnificus]